MEEKEYYYVFTFDVDYGGKVLIFHCRVFDRAALPEGDGIGDWLCVFCSGHNNCKI